MTKVRALARKLTLALLPPAIVLIVACSSGGQTPGTSPSATNSPASNSPSPGPSATAAATEAGATATSLPARPEFNTAVVGPYLQQCTSNSAYVVWESDVAAKGSVAIGRPGQIQQFFDDPRVTDHHIVRVHGLTAGTVYEYEVMTGERLEARSTFRTAPRTGSGAFTFAVIGDSGTGSPEQFAVADVIDSLDPDIMLHVGDVIYPRGEAELYGPNFFAPYRDVLPDACFFPIAGDHDLITEDGAPYLDRFILPANNPSGSEMYYSIDYGPVHFLFLDTIPFEKGGELSQIKIAEMARWAEEDLASTGQPWKIAVLHHPPYSSGSKHASYLDVRSIFSPIFEKYGVSLVFSGDDHNYERTYPVRQYETSSNGTTYVVTGGGGASTRAVSRNDFTAYIVQKYHLVRVTVDPNSLKLEAVDQHGVVFDTSEILLDQPPPQIYSGGGSLALQDSYVVCASDTPDTSVCDFRGDGVDDQVEINQALAACPVDSCTVKLAAGTFHMEARDHEDSIRLRSFTRLEFQAGSVIRFRGVLPPSDRYVIDLDGTLDPVRDAYVGGPGRIEVTLPMDHGLRVKGRAQGVTIGDGLHFVHLDPEVSIDEAVQVTGEVDIQDLTLRDLTIEHFGRAGDAAHGIEMVGLVRNSTIERLNSIENRRALTLRGTVDPAVSVMLERSSRAPLEIDPLHDRKAATSEVVQIDSRQSLLVGSDGRFNGIYLDIVTGNTAPADLEIAVSDGTGGWVPLEVDEDTTATGGAPLSRSGYIHFTPPSGDTWANYTYAKNPHYWLRISASSALSLITISEVSAVQAPTDNLVVETRSTGEVSEAFWFKSGDRNELRDVVITDPGLTGIRLEANKGPDPRQNHIINVTVTGAGAEGILLLDAPDTVITGGALRDNAAGVVDSSSRSTGLVMTGTVIEGNRGNGMTLTSGSALLDQVQVTGNGRATELEDADRAGIRITGGEGYEIRDSALLGGGVPTQSYGLYIDGPGGRTVVRATVIEGNLTGGVYDPDAVVVVRE